MVKWTIITLLLMGIGMVNAVTIGSDVELGGYYGIYTPAQTTINVDVVFVTDSAVGLEGYGTFLECWAETNGVAVDGAGFEGVLCQVPPVGGDKIQVYDIINKTSNITLLNQTGNRSVYSFKYNGTGGGQIQLFKLENISGACNYGSEDVSGSNIKLFSFPFNNTVAYGDCNVTIYTNASSQLPVWVDVEEDEDVSNLALASAVAGLLTVMLYKAYQWDSITS